MNSDKAPRGRPKTLDRDHVVDVAMHAYWKEGVNNLSLNEICRRAEVSKPGLYREFGNEDGLMKVVLSAYQAQVLGPVYQMIAADAPFHETLNNLIEMMTTVDDDPEMPKGCFLVKLRESYSNVGKATQAQVDEAKVEALTVYEDWIERAKASGAFSAEMSSQFTAVYIDAQLSNALSQIARGEDSQLVKKVLIVAFSILQ